MAFTNEEVSNYYDQTAVHYRYFWKLEESMALHYGIWRNGIKTLQESLIETNKELAQQANIQASDRVLDAGCGVGGSSIYLAKNIGCQAVGVTLSQQQADEAKANASRENVAHLVDFHQKDYTNTGFQANSFDVVWGIECHLTESTKETFVKEAQRVLKNGGRLIIGEYFKTSENLNEKQHKTLQKWLNYEAIADMVTLEKYKEWLEDNGFTNIRVTDVTKEITPSAKKIYQAALMGAIGTKAYNWFVKKASYFSRVHYKGQIAQYQALKMKAWTYQIVYAEYQGK